MYLALDQSIRISGWSIYDDRGNLKECGKWTIPSDLPIGARLEKFISYLNDLSENYNINKVFFEDIQMQNGNVETYKKLAYTQAMILYWCEIHNKECEILSPSHWRAVLKQEYKINFGRQRKEQKQAALCFVKEHFGREVTEDEADAICLGLAGIITKDIKEGAFLMITTEDKLYLEELKAINENLASLINKVEDLYKEIKVQENHLKDSPHMSL